MQIDRSYEIHYIDGKPTEVPLDSMHIYLEEDDIERLCYRQRVTQRFMECAINGFGVESWAPEDKIHIMIEDKLGAEYDERFIDLNVDQGGDLYFTIWDRPALYDATNDEELIMSDTLPTIDPSNKLGQVGISSMYVYNLRHLANRLAGMKTLR